MRLFSKQMEDMSDSEIVHGHELWKTNIRLHNLTLKKLIDTNQKSELTINDYGLLKRLLDETTVDIITKRINTCLESLLVSSTPPPILLL